ncbi:unnamed protein product [Vitrella brassicaformis CCMP3155]|uniref:Uncharacterized protein n=1 Tax=Vitrella brassicaformis (strain CCMP3155) TaxID=1169540 RepID=A0A0G4GZU4_VITBC|nr:unnamed protein product [Vitrella brassicaformis CCMP3155]|eukprot:CEM36711.1 unnamed protein product [Vitrella brassicaformis CCMP3155]
MLCKRCDSGFHSSAMRPGGPQADRRARGKLVVPHMHTPWRCQPLVRRHPRPARLPQAPSRSVLGWRALTRGVGDVAVGTISDIPISRQGQHGMCGSLPLDCAPEDPSAEAFGLLTCVEKRRRTRSSLSVPVAHSDVPFTADGPVEEKRMKRMR